MNRNTFKQHQAHEWSRESTDHIHNVPAVDTHALMRCPCGFAGWVPLALFGDNVPDAPHDKNAVTTCDCGKR